MIKIFDKKRPRFIYLVFFIVGLFLVYWIGHNFLNFSINFIALGLSILIVSMGLFLIFIRQPIYGVMLLVITLPLERIPSLEVAGYTLKINQIVVIILFFAFLAIIIQKKDYKIIKNPLVSFLLLFLSACALSFLNAHNLSRAILVFLLLNFVIIIFILIPNIVRNENHLKSITKFLFLITFLICLFGLYQYFGDLIGLSTSLTGLRTTYTKEILGFTRIQSTFLEPLYLANFLIIPLSLFSALFLTDQIKMKWYFIVLFISLILVVFILTISRGGYLGLAVAFILIIIFKLKSFFSFKKLSIIILTLIISGTLALIFLGNARTQFFRHNKGPLVGEQQASSEERETTSKLSLNAFYKNPILGIGLGNFGPYYNHYLPQMPPNGWQTVNNQYLEILAETGILGLITFLLFIFALFLRSRKAYSIAKRPYLSAYILGTSAALLGILTQYYLFSTLYIIYIWFLIGLLVATQNIIFQKDEK